MEQQIQSNSFINYCKEKKYDRTRAIISWVLMFIVVGIFWFIKPAVTIHTSPMYLPIITDLPPIAKNEVDLIDHVNFDNYFLYKKVGHITITANFNSNDGEAIYYKLVDDAKGLAAKAGANRLFIEGTGVSDWFDSGKKTFRLRALALQQ